MKKLKHNGNEIWNIIELNKYFKLNAEMLIDLMSFRGDFLHQLSHANMSLGKILTLNSTLKACWCPVQQLPPAVCECVNEKL